MQLEAEPPWTMKQLLKGKKLRYPLLLLCALQAGQQLSGINVVSSLPDPKEEEFRTSRAIQYK